MIDQEKLCELVCEALERTAMVFAEPMESDSPDGITRVARIIYEGEESGEMILAASDGFALELASSMLGEDEDAIAADNEGALALAELANIVCGSVVVAIGGEQRAITLGLPEVAEPSPADGDGIRCVVESMGEPLVVTWRPSRKAA